MTTSARTMVSLAAGAVCVVLVGCGEPTSNRTDLSPATQPTGTPRRAGATVAGKGQLLNQVAGGGGQRYQLYLPSVYRPNRQWPLIYFLCSRADPAEGPSLDGVLLATADREGWILLLSTFQWPYPVRGDGSGEGKVGRPDADLRRANAVLDNVLGRWSVDRRHMFATAGDGVSAQLATALVINRPGRFAGMVLYWPKALGDARPAMKAPDTLREFPVLLVWGRDGPEAFRPTVHPKHQVLLERGWFNAVGFGNVRELNVLTGDRVDVAPMVEFVRARVAGAK